MSLTTSSNSAQPGGSLTVTGREFAAGGAPVIIHLDTTTGPVLATVPVPGQDTMSSKFSVNVSLPADIGSGQHLLVATQDAHDMNSGAPARAVFYVGGAAPATATAVHRPKALAADSGQSVANLVVIALVVAGVSVAVGGLFSWLGGRGGRRSAPSPAAS